MIESKAAVEAELHLELRPAINVGPLKTMSKATTVMNVQVALE